jgi:hypothetical protein
VSEWVDSASKPQLPTSQPHPTDEGGSHLQPLSESERRRQYQSGMEMVQSDFAQPDPYPDRGGPPAQPQHSGYSWQPAVLKNTRLVAGACMQTADTSFSPLSDSAAAWRSPYHRIDPYQHQPLPDSRQDFPQPAFPPSSQDGWPGEVGGHSGATPPLRSSTSSSGYAVNQQPSFSPTKLPSIPGLRKFVSRLLQPLTRRPSEKFSLEALNAELDDEIVSSSWGPPHQPMNQVQITDDCLSDTLEANDDIFLMNQNQTSKNPRQMLPLSDDGGRAPPSSHSRRDNSPQKALPGRPQINPTALQTYSHTDNPALPPQPSHPGLVHNVQASLPALLQTTQRPPTGDYNGGGIGKQARPVSAARSNAWLRPAGLPETLPLHGGHAGEPSSDHHLSRGAGSQCSPYFRDECEMLDG